MTSRLVFLVPGFFGFSSVGAVGYFEQVEQTLATALGRRGLTARIVRCRTRPTASIPRRAAALAREVVEAGGLRARELHFVGHSTGGLDVRLLLTPGARLADGERIGARTRSAIAVATPHHGTPLANHFLTIQGQTLLLVLSGLASSGPGRGSLVAAAKAIALAARLDDWLGRAEGPLDRISSELLSPLRVGRGDPVWRYLREMERDQGAVLQLTPEGTDLFHAAVRDRAGVRYGCVVTGVPARSPRPRASDLLNPEWLALRSVFRLLHGLAGRPHPRYPMPRPSAAVRRRLARDLGFGVSAASNDGVVPTLSQLHGRLLHATRADHLDVVGHYTLAGGRSADWLPSAAGFTPAAFAATWDAVAAAIARAARG
jgi:hypothetical protein